MSNVEHLFGEPIHTYSRADAIADGVLIDVSADVREAGFRFPVAVTAAVWDAYVEVPEGVLGQDIKGRLWDIVFMAAMAIRRSPEGGAVLLYELLVRNDNRRPRPVTLKLHIGPGDNFEPVVTIMTPDED